MARGSVLVSGAGVAGATAAYWLTRAGYEVTVLERTPTLRTAGQNIDVRGAGREVARRMGVEGRIREATTGEVGTRFVDEDGSVLAEFAAGSVDSDGATAELEILRGDLTRLLADLTEHDAEYRFGDRITMAEQDADGVDVTFEQAGPRRFDLLVIAEGMRSRTREMVFLEPTHELFRDLGLFTAYGTIDRTPDDDRWWRIYHAGAGRAVTLRPDPKGTARATLSFLTPALGYDVLDDDARRRLLRDRFEGAGWETDRILDGFDAHPDELYAEHTGQIRTPTWWHGRVVLIGDAAHCASPISGMGTSLALTGGYVLAGELATAGGHHHEAFYRYDALMRPYAEKAQQLPPGGPRPAHPRTRAGVAVLRGAVRLAGSRPARTLGRALPGQRFAPPADAIDLPDYGF